MTLELDKTFIRNGLFTNAQLSSILRSFLASLSFVRSAIGHKPQVFLCQVSINLKTQITSDLLKPYALSLLSSLSDSAELDFRFIAGHLCGYWSGPETSGQRNST